MTKEYREYAKSRIEYLLKISKLDERDKEALEAAIQALSQEPTSEMVHVETLHQVMWERDIAIEQLKELGYSFGQKIEPCDDAISRQAVLAIAYDSCLDLDNYDDTEEFCDEIKELPSVTPKSETVTEFADRCRECGKMRKGHWIYDETIENWRCSKCNETPKTMGYVGTADFMAEHFKFCNHCGAKMESEE